MGRIKGSCTTGRCAKCGIPIKKKESRGHKRQSAFCTNCAWSQMHKGERG